MAGKICKMCGAIKPATEEHWYVSKIINGKIYYRGTCRECVEKYGYKAHGGRASAGVLSPEGNHIYSATDFVSALITLSRNDVGRLASISEAEFKSKTRSSAFLRKTGMSFKDIKSMAFEQLRRDGYANPEDIRLPAGVYMIVGDSHGKWTRRPMFDLLRRVSRELRVDAVIHVGHIVDDDNEISYLWDDFDNLVVVAKPEELRTVHRYVADNSLRWRIVRDRIAAGGVNICNQELISDYARVPLRLLDSQLFEDRTICNLHRLERAPRCTDAEAEYIASPGCVCEPHIVKTIRQIDFKEGYIQKLAYPTGFSKYRRASQLSRLWNQGFILLKVTSAGSFLLQCQIHTVGKQKACAIFDKIYTSSGVEKPDRKIMAVADTHSPEFDPRVLEVQKQIAKRFAGDCLVDLGDIISFGSLNHHSMERGEISEYASKDIMKECAVAHAILKARGSWAPWKRRVLLYANHERFCQDFVRKNPQLASLLNVPTLLAVESAGYELVAHKTPLKIGPFLFIHGDMKLYGETGRLPDKLSKAFNIKRNMAVVHGHTHSSEIRQRSYSVPMSGTTNQLYNETAASYWNQGCALCSSYKEAAFVQIIDCVYGRSWYADEVISGLGAKGLLPKKMLFSINYKESQ